MRRVYSAYAGIGSAYAMVATYKDQSAAYVPTFSYACETTSIKTDGCSMLRKIFFLKESIKDFAIFPPHKKKNLFHNLLLKLN